MPEHRPAAGQPPPDRARAVDRAQPGHAGGVRADARHHEPVGVLGGLPVTGEGDLGAGPLDRADGGAQVAGAVVEDDDGLRRAQSEPLVEGTPVSRGSSATASRKARANALNCVSTMWCGSRPASTRTCSAIWAWKASVSKTCRVSEPR